MILFLMACVEPTYFTAAVSGRGQPCGEAVGVETACGLSATCVDPAANLCEASHAKYGDPCTPGSPERFYEPTPCRGCYSLAAPCGPEWCGWMALCTDDEQCRLVADPVCDGREIEEEEPDYDLPSCPESCRPVE